MKITHDYFIAKFNRSGDRTKLSFLISLLHADRALQEKFIAFAEQKEEDDSIPSVDEFAVAIRTCQEEIADKLGRIDLQYPDLDNYVPSHSGYRKDWEICEEASQQELQAVLDHYQALAAVYLKNQNLAGMYIVLFGLLLACRETELKDPVPAFDDVNDYLLEILPHVFSGVSDKIDFAIVSEMQIRSVLVLILDYCFRYRKNDTNLLLSLQPVIYALTKKLKNGKEVLTRYQEEQIGKILPQVHLHLLWTCGQREEWHVFARKSYLRDPHIAHQLLLYYRDTESWMHFKDLGRQLFYSDKSYWAELIQPLVNLERDRSLYLDVHLHLIKRHRDLDLYKKLQPELSQQQKNQLIDEIYDNKFFVDVLTVEKRYEDIKQCVSTNHDSYDFVDIMTPIIDIYPGYCFTTIKKTVKKQLETERGRRVYRRIVSKLKLARQIKGFESKAELLIREIYQENNRLSALRDEMRVSDLISD